MNPRGTFWAPIRFRVGRLRPGSATPPRSSGANLPSVSPQAHAPRSLSAESKSRRSSEPFMALGATAVGAATIFSTAAAGWSGDRCAYRCTMLSVRHPPSSWTVRKSTPADTRREAPPTPPAASRARSRTFRGADAQRLGKQWARAASGGEALQDLLAPPIGEPERDPAIEIDPLKHKRERRVALRPPRIGQVLLRGVREGARPQEEGAPARPDDRFQCPEELAALVEHALFDDFVRPSQDRLRDFNADRLGGFEVDDQLKLRGPLHGQVGGLRALQDPMASLLASRASAAHRRCDCCRWGSSPRRGRSRTRQRDFHGDRLSESAS